MKSVYITLFYFYRIFSFPDSILNTIFSNDWRCFSMPFTTMESPIPKKLLYNLCINGQLLCFAYNIVRSKNNMYVICKILPAYSTSVDQLWKTHYITPNELTNVKESLSFYMCKELELRITEVKDKCEKCQMSLYGDELMCLNKDCSHFDIGRTALKRYVSNLNGELLLHSNSDTPVTNLACKKCLACKLCKKYKTKKCFRHTTCTHKQSSNSYYVTLNKIARK
ncbi:hypothetical protein MrNuV_ORF115 [Macrobrachium rosenbergii nudivirus]|nr:hypothetical protein MrNuV_ORF115 [Macrobrachium rosenbergii nudivirus]